MGKQKDYIYLVRRGNHYRIEAASGVNQDHLCLVHRIQTQNMDALRCSLFEHFTEKKMEGEWFELDNSDVALLKRIEYTKGVLSEEAIALIIEEGAGGN